MLEGDERFRAPSHSNLLPDHLTESVSQKTDTLAGHSKLPRRVTSTGVSKSTAIVRSTAAVQPPATTPAMATSKRHSTTSPAAPATARVSALIAAQATAEGTTSSRAGSHAAEASRQSEGKSAAQEDCPPAKRQKTNYVQEISSVDPSSSVGDHDDDE
jgi:hypothetical protein